MCACIGPSGEATLLGKSNELDKVGSPNDTREQWAFGPMKCVVTGDSSLGIVSMSGGAQGRHSLVSVDLTGQKPKVVSVFDEAPGAARAQDIALSPNSAWLARYSVGADNAPALDIFSVDPLTQGVAPAQSLSASLLSITGLVRGYPLLRFCSHDTLVVLPRAPLVGYTYAYNLVKFVLDAGTRQWAVGGISARFRRVPVDMICTASTAVVLTDESNGALWTFQLATLQKVDEYSLPSEVGETLGVQAVSLALDAANRNVLPPCDATSCKWVPSTGAQVAVVPYSNSAYAVGRQSLSLDPVGFEVPTESTPSMLQKINLAGRTLDGEPELLLPLNLMEAVPETALCFAHPPPPGSPPPLDPALAPDGVGRPVNQPSGEPLAPPRDGPIHAPGCGFPEAPDGSPASLPVGGYTSDAPPPGGAPALAPFSHSVPPTPLPAVIPGAAPGAVQLPPAWVPALASFPHSAPPTPLPAVIPGAAPGAVYPPPGGTSNGSIGSPPPPPPLPSISSRPPLSAEPTPAPFAAPERSPEPTGGGPAPAPSVLAAEGPAYYYRVPELAPVPSYVPAPPPMAGAAGRSGGAASPAAVIIGK
eukprot:jgi/Mesen1/4683/ME000241S03729